MEHWSRNRTAKIAWMRLVNNDDGDVRKLAMELIDERDPRKDVGLDAWGALLGSEWAHEYATEKLDKHFGASELTLGWFAKLFENDDTLAFMDIGPVSRGHALVIPKTHYDPMMDTPDDVLQKLIIIVKKIIIV